ncbi:(4Fe-4S)-binding protein [Kurthia massiliensis]|uniref:(4Fe-4S)-binding protein n=1 Tax=Kurthia massiliensis TaxID=1033739 RepID=UPI0002882EDB|nr:(4Fe-4S)-binding protein [Kurthia massiliensis]
MNEQQLLDNGYRKYSGEAVDIFFNLDICQHSGNCVNGNRDVFDTKRKPWIIADNASADEVARVIETCPSGALHYIRK